MALSEYANLALDRLHRRIRKRGRHLAKLPDYLRHQVRKDTKKLRYAHDFLTSLYQSKRTTRKRKAFGKALGRLQAALGALNDMAMKEQHLKALCLSEQGEAESLADKHQHKKLLRQAIAARHDMLKSAPYWRGCPV